MLMSCFAGWNFRRMVLLTVRKALSLVILGDTLSAYSNPLKLGSERKGSGEQRMGSSCTKMIYFGQLKYIELSNSTPLPYPPVLFSFIGNEIFRDSSGGKSLLDYCGINFIIGCKPHYLYV